MGFPNIFKWLAKLFNTLRMKYSDKLLKYAIPIAESITNADIDMSGGVSEDHPVVREIIQTILQMGQPLLAQTLFGFYLRPDGTVDLAKLSAQAPEVLIRLLAVVRLVKKLLSADIPVPSKGLLETTTQRAYEATHPQKDKVRIVYPVGF